MGAIYRFYLGGTPRGDAESQLEAVGERLRKTEPMSTGVPLGAENFDRRPAEFLDQAKIRKLDELREKYDPEEMFHKWMGRRSPSH